MSESRTFKRKEGQWVKTESPTKEQLLSLSEQQARMFTPDGQLRLVAETRENASKGRLKPMSLPR